MSATECKICGGPLKFEAGQTVTTCEYCGRQVTISAMLDDEKIARLYERANHFHRNNDYDKALAVYEMILNENSEDAEAYWSVVLCRYGIEYVEDKRTGKRIPTINRAQFTSVLADDDYKLALQYADPLQRNVYEHEARALDEIQKNILKIVKNEDPYDVFICYKDKDSAGQPTQDRVIATEIYNRLTRENFKVFFAYVTLDEKLGHEYEPYIFSALQSAKVMIVLGTRPEHFKAVWVKNEWSRYLALIKGGAKKTLICAYKNMDAYDLPDELSLQAQDMDKMGFIENLVFNVRREIERNSDKKVKAHSSPTVITSTGENAKNYTKRGFMALEDEAWSDAETYFDKALNLDPECGQAYAGMLLADILVSSFDKLVEAGSDYGDSVYYRRAMQFGDSNLKRLLQESLLKIKYRNACDMMKSGSYEAALDIFESIRYKDSASKADECRQRVSVIKKERKERQLREEQARIERQQREELEKKLQQQRQEHEIRLLKLNKKLESLEQKAAEFKEKVDMGKPAIKYILVNILLLPFMALLIIIATKVPMSLIPVVCTCIGITVISFMIYAAVVYRKIYKQNLFFSIILSYFGNIITWFILFIRCLNVMFQTPKNKAQYRTIQQEISQCQMEIENENKSFASKS